uniref:Uncharacterized protein n=2 Tax=Aegilops tauschii subsp. strangulata TaxID=200361 RepID=A0A453MGI6_AEGTS
VGSAAYSATSIVVVMAKDKGRGKGTKGGAASSSAANKVDRRPPRITSNVKQNLRIVKFWKDYERRQTTGPQPATRFRKKKIMKEVLPDDTDFYEDPSATLTCTNDGSVEIASPVILVDGYNVCGYWGKLKSDFLNGNQGIARQMLIDELVSFSAVREIKVVVVFDAALSGQSTHTETYKGVDVVYSADLSADCWIEKEVNQIMKFSIRWN